MDIKSFAKTCSTAIATLVLASCGDDKKDSDLADARVYKADSPYASVIAECARAEQVDDSCSLNRLPVIGMDYNDPGIPQIMDRVVVSHDWMGERFEELLYEMPEGMLPLFKGVTAIVIDADIRPAYYSAATGSIYLDPQFIWLSVEEKQTINPKEDYRSGFDDPLAFRQLQRYLIDGEPAYQRGSLEDNSTREMDDIIRLAAALFLHELAHANDFIPPDTYDSVDMNLGVAEAAQSIADHWISSRLSHDSPLASETMFSLADVMFSGAEPTVDDLEITAYEVGLAFEPDGAADDYGYTTQFEDMAMLFETSMMKYFFDAEYEMAFTSVPENPAYCNFYEIGWGVRNRVGDENVKPRAEFVANELLPNEDLDSFFDNLENPTEISGDWCLTPSSLEDDKPSVHAIDDFDLLRPYL